MRNTLASSIWQFIPRCFPGCKGLRISLQRFQREEFAFAAFNIIALNQKFAWLQLWAYKFYLRCSIHIQFQLNSESYSWVLKCKVLRLSYKGPDIFPTPATPSLIPCAICLIQALRVVMSLYICSCHDLCHSFPSPIPTLGWLLLLLNLLQGFISLWNISYIPQPFQPCHTIPIIYAVFQLHTFRAYSENFTNFNAHMISKSTFKFI